MNTTNTISQSRSGICIDCGKQFTSYRNQRKRCIKCTERRFKMKSGVYNNNRIRKPQLGRKKHLTLSNGLSVLDNILGRTMYRNTDLSHTSAGMNEVVIRKANRYYSE
jgi:DNA-directed RNA polymerase subunit RPC12/RpoP